MNKTTIQIWHEKSPHFSCPKHTPDMADYELMTTMAVDSDDINTCLESMYSFSQNIDEAWREPPCRSTSVGDVMVVIDPRTNETISVHAVDSFGFREFK